MTGIPAQLGRADPPCCRGRYRSTATVSARVGPSVVGRRGIRACQAGSEVDPDRCEAVKSLAGRAGTGLRRLLDAMCNLVVGPPAIARGRGRPGQCQRCREARSAEPVFASSRSMPVSPGNRGVHADVPGDEALRVGLGLQLLRGPLPGAVTLPAAEQVVGPVPRPVPLRDVCRAHRRWSATVGPRSAFAASRSVAVPASPACARLLEGEGVVGPGRPLRYGRRMHEQLAHQGLTEGAMAAAG